MAIVVNQRLLPVRFGADDKTIGPIRSQYNGRRGSPRCLRANWGERVREPSHVITLLGSFGPALTPDIVVLVAETTDDGHVASTEAYVGMLWTRGERINGHRGIPTGVQEFSSERRRLRARCIAVAVDRSRPRDDVAVERAAKDPLFEIS